MACSPTPLQLRTIKSSTPLILVLLLTSFCQPRHGQPKYSSGLDTIVTKIAEIDMVQGRAVGYSGTRPMQYTQFEKLEELATTDDLKALTNHPTPTVRCYAFWALANNNSPDLFPIALSHLDDTDEIETQFGCIVSKETVADFFINIAQSNLSAVQVATLDSILIYTPNNLLAKSTAMERLKPTEAVYPRLRELVIEEHDGDALVLLAGYKKEQDVEIMLKRLQEGESEHDNLSYACQAIARFPHPDFLPLLEETLRQTLDDTHFSNEWQDLYKAIASYKNDKAKALLEIPFTQVKHNDIKQFHIQFVVEALDEHKDPVYDDLLWQLWAEEKRITPDIYLYFLSKDPQKTLQLAKESLKNTETMYEVNSNHFYGKEPENLLITMLDLVTKDDRNAGVEAVRNNINVAGAYLFSIFAGKAAELKDQSFVEPLFRRLETAPDTEICLDAAKALIAYQTPSFNQRIIAARKKNKQLRDGWGIDAFNKLLKKSHIQ